MNIELDLPDGCAVSLVEGKLVIETADEYTMEMHRPNLIVLKPVAKPLPESWQDLTKIKGACVVANKTQSIPSHLSANLANKNIYPTVKLAEAGLALIQLLQLRDRYNGDWEPDWTDDREDKYCIEYLHDKISLNTWNGYQKVLHFETYEKRNHFVKFHKELIETAKPLL